MACGSAPVLSPRPNRPPIPAYQEALLRAEPEDTILTEAYSANWPNAPHRVLRGCIEAAQALTDDLVGQTVIAGATLPLMSDAKLFANRSALFANDAESAMIACSLL
jgi:hypothetical protein